jgi:hypothetical protein
VLDLKRMQDRRGLRQLDACLQDLEDAHERDQDRVSEELATRVGAHVPDVVPGMPIRAAIDRVFSAQRQYVRASEPGGDEYSFAFAPAPTPATDQASGEGILAARAHRRMLDADGARRLTNQIRMVTRHMCLLLLEAHDGRAWVALGYRTWDEYVQRELGLSRTRSYEFLDQAHVIRAIMDAVDLCAVPDISAYAAAQVKRHLPEVIEAIQRRLEERSGESAQRLVGEVIDEKRTNLGEGDRRRRAGIRSLARPRDAAVVALDPAGVDWLFDVIDLLSKMPPVSETLARIGERPSRQPPSVERAAAWLSELAAALSRETMAGRR